MPNDQQIRVSDQTWKDLSARKEPGDSFNTVVRRLLNTDPDRQAVRNALDDLETAADYVRGGANNRHNGDMIQESVDILRDELGVNDN